MENKDYKNNFISNEIGYLAKILDTEMTISERMKIKKSSVKKIFGALIVYFSIIAIFSIIL